MRTSGVDRKSSMISGASRSGASHGRCALLVRAAAAVLGATLALPGVAAAARVSGTLLSYRGEPLASRDLHFENCVTHDIYLSPTHTDGSFSQQLPPGCYRLRAEKGALLVPAIAVGDTDVAVGRVSELAPLSPKRLFELQSLFPTLLSSPAPSTAYIFTRDTTAVSPSAKKIPVASSESEWLKLKNQTATGASAAGSQAKAGAMPSADANAAPDLSEPTDLGGPPMTAPSSGQ